VNGIYVNSGKVLITRTTAIWIKSRRTTKKRLRKSIMSLRRRKSDSEEISRRVRRRMRMIKEILRIRRTLVRTSMLLV